MRRFMGEDFLLGNEVARRLYHDYAAAQPIFDYHCHLPPEDIASDVSFSNMTNIWLAGDHYKWRAMRTAGIDEALITGSASDYAKYQAWARTVPQCIGNPLYHWTHLELRRPFGIEGTLFGPDSAEAIWHTANDCLADKAFSARGILKKMNVVLVGTTDDPLDDLRHHKAIADDTGFDVRVVPTWRPDRAFKAELDGFAEYMKALGALTGNDIRCYADLVTALLQRIDHFAQHGCVAADHGIEVLRYAPVPAESTLDAILKKGLSGQGVSDLEAAQFATAVQVMMGQEYARRGWVMQLHIGALRSNSSRMLAAVGPNTGFDSIADAPLAANLAALLDTMDRDDLLPKTILYCLNPADNDMIATMIGNFQGGGIAGKIQFGSGWWFNDQKDGMIRQMASLANMGLLSQFVGMLTDSRSFLSFTRHEYFRRILCQMIGRWVADGEAPNDLELLGSMVSNICFRNAERYFGGNPTIQGS
ncbi:glucuronate isomerase [Pokkaliibacter sp. MBI-7]|uniref:glucuronate isomerase n=1 Tax=Pokkaliibacter sp. MBI-7 TaxID=3040600 RepID=UPI00244BE0D0|nr:glucuronate isomerase [Pokkaliibacter sp. MBI-7]MDH2435406.1 glucuronate isomerase [Pokkaliibacter sp. MBI-7]